MDTAILFTEFTELDAIAEKLDTTKAFELIRFGDSLSETPKNLIVDLTVDFFRPDTNPAFLFKVFSNVWNALEEMASPNTTILVARGVPFRCNIKAMNVRQRILENFIELLKEFFHAKIMVVPSIISRYTLKRLQNPCLRIVNAVQNDESEKIKFKPDSRFSIIYAMDLLSVLLSHCDKRLEKNILIEGLPITLDSVYEATQKIAGHTALSFDTRNHIHYEYTDLFSETIREINYTFEAMVIDMMSSLF